MKWQRGRSLQTSLVNSFTAQMGKLRLPAGPGAHVGQPPGEQSSHCGTRDPPRLRNLDVNRDSSKGQGPTAILSDLKSTVVLVDYVMMPEIAGWHLLSSDLHDSFPSRLTMKLRPRHSSKGQEWAARHMMGRYQTSVFIIVSTDPALANLAALTKERKGGRNTSTCLQASSKPTSSLLYKGEGKPKLLATHSLPKGS